MIAEMLIFTFINKKHSTMYRNIALLIVILSIVTACKKQAENKIYQPGVSLSLAQERFQDLSDVDYKLTLVVPDDMQAEIKGTSVITLNKANPASDLVLDFKAKPEQVKSVIANDQKAFFTIENEHLIIPHRFLTEGKNQLEISFTLGDDALNRNENYFYSLFVPAKARTAIPCIDQPDMKASVTYEIEMPKQLTAITNGQQDFYEDLPNNRKRIGFTTTKPISTYLWAFAVGDFQEVTMEQNNRKITLYHMENDPGKVESNLKAIFKQVFHAIDWLEDYTQIPIPFENYNLVCIPSFQFAGMEHPGAIYYRSELLFLSENPTQQQLLRRAQLLAHETAHLWFGDLVTMKWFSGVWQKEVFANFMADKIVEQQFPNLNHQLTFLRAHFPSSYAVDRTIGANPIQQDLENLKDAGSMYGSIIYHKAPIMMKQLENLAGKEILQKGLSEYLKQYSYSNATWKQLMEILNNHSEYDLQLWSNTWVYAAGRPIIQFTEENDQCFAIQQPEHSDSSKVWAQRISFAYLNDSILQKEELEILSAKTVLDSSIVSPNIIIPGIDENGYGLFLMNQNAIEYTLENLQNFESDLMKGGVLVQLYENLLHGNIHPIKYIKALQNFIQSEENQQLLTLECRQLKTIYWEMIPSAEREKIASSLENTIRKKMSNTNISGSKKLLFETWSNIVISPSALKELKKIIKKGAVEKIDLSDREICRAAYQLALKDKEINNEYLQNIAQQIKDENLNKEMDFISPVFSNDEEIRNNFFNQLQQKEFRQKENWVLNAIAFLHHPYHNESELKYLEPALSLTEEIKETGDIFFPAGWLNNTLRGYSSNESLKIIDYFFKDHPQFPLDLKNKVLQASDLVARRNQVKRKYFN